MRLELPIQCSKCKERFSPVDLHIVEGSKYLCDDCYDKWADAEDDKNE